MPEGRLSELRRSGSGFARTALAPAHPVRYGRGSEGRPAEPRGVALVSAVMLLVVIGLVAALLLSVHSNTLSLQTAGVQRLRAEAAALAATQLAVWKVGSDTALQDKLARVVAEHDTSFSASSLFQISGTLAGASFAADLWPGPDTLRIRGRGVADGHYCDRWVQMPMLADASVRVLLVVRDPNSPNSQESARMQLMESWGWSVALIDQSASQSAYNAAAADADVAYIAEDAWAFDIGTKLRNVPIGVAVEEVWLTGFYGFSFLFGCYNGHSINVTNNSHYITQPFATGMLQVFSSSTDMKYCIGPYGGGAQILTYRSSNNDPTLVVIEAGQPLFGGGNAAGRRVCLPWGCGDLDFNKLNADGQTLLRRALEWAANKEESP